MKLYFNVIILSFLFIACNESEQNTSENASATSGEESAEAKAVQTKTVDLKSAELNSSKASKKKTVKPVKKVPEKVVAQPKEPEAETTYEAPVVKDGKILYNASRRLRWNNFKGRANRSTGLAAFTETGISYEPKDFNNEFVVLEVISFFDVYKSWVDSKKKSKYLLNHEQKHFDICELHRRKMMKAFNDAQPISQAKFNSVVKKIFRSNFATMNAMQRKYDHETDHSIIKSKQAKWDKKIASDLRKLDKYKKMKIKLKLRK